MLVLQGKMSVGSLLATLVMNLFISVGMASVAASLGEVGKAVGALERITEIVDAPAGPGDASPAGAAGLAAAAPAAAEEGAGGAGRSASGAAASASGGGAVAFRGVGVRYPGRQDWALRGLDLEVPAGATLALVGPSGGGKSTVVALLTGQYQASEGGILVDGEPLPAGGPALEAVRARMGAVFQAPMLMSGSVADQIRFGKPDASLFEVRRLRRVLRCLRVRGWMRLRPCCCRAGTEAAPLPKRLLRRWRRLRRRPTPTASSGSCPRATPPTSGSGGTRCRAGRSSGWPSRAPWSGSQR